MPKRRNVGKTDTNALKRNNAQTPKRQYAETAKLRNAETQKCWNAETPKRWNARTLNRRNAELLEHCNAETLKCHGAFIAGFTNYVGGLFIIFLQTQVFRDFTANHRCGSVVTPHCQHPFKIMRRTFLRVFLNACVMLLRSLVSSGCPLS